DLGEAAEMLAQASGNEHRRLVQGNIVVPAQMLWRRGLVLVRVGKRRNRHCRNRDRGVCAERIAAQLELTSERRELRAEASDVTRLARLPGLLRESGNCPRGARRSHR